MRQLLGRLKTHFAIGAGLGTFLALTLLISNTDNIFTVIADSAHPQLYVMLLVTTWCMALSIGSTLTGWAMIRT